MAPLSIQTLLLAWGGAFSRLLRPAAAARLSASAVRLESPRDVRFLIAATLYRQAGERGVLPRKAI
jgi:hypothetical protein